MNDHLRRLYVLGAAALGMVFLLQAIPNIDQALKGTPWDLNVDRLTALAYLDHYSPFSTEGAIRSGLAASGPAGNGHPPTTSFWFLPLARMDAHTAATTLAWITVSLFLLQLAATMTLLGYAAPLTSAWLAFGYVLSTSFMRYHIDVGQVSGVIGFLLFVGWAAGRRGDDWLAGAALGAACTMKMFPGVMVILFIVARRWRAAVGAIVVYIVIAAIMTARFGLLSWPQFLAQQAPIADQWMANIQNQSIHGIVLRWFWPVCGPHGPVLRSATLISGALSLALLTLSVWLVRKMVRSGGFDLAYALFVVLSIVASQWTWEHYSIIYPLPLLILGAHLLKLWRTGKHKVGVAAMLAIVAGVVASWSINMSTKFSLQASVRQGHTGDHMRLHAYDVLNWIPGLAVLAVLLLACWWAQADGSQTFDESPKLSS